jgi:pimeloyl-ACP methyl ester carboxylesterase
VRGTSHETGGLKQVLLSTKPQDFVTHSLTSIDGAVISYQVIGYGPGLVLVHGAGLAASSYHKLALSLADSYMVYLLDRRGHGKSGSPGNDYSFEKEREDVMALLKPSQASLLFGHSSGGVIGLEVALTYPLKKLALYEPAVTMDGSVPSTWLPDFERALAQKKYVEAEAILIQGLMLAGPASNAPLGILKLLVWLTIHGAERAVMLEALPTVPLNVKDVKRLDGHVEKYQHVTVDTLLMTGRRGPGYLREAARGLTSILPHAQLFDSPTFQHNAPDHQAPRQVAHILKQFFGTESLLEKD